MKQFEIKDFSFKYPDTEKLAIEGINLDIDEGEFVLICGESGSGKSTLLRQLKTAIAPNGKKKGDIFYYGEKIDTLDERRAVAEIGFVLQSPEEQIVTDKVWHELAFGLEGLGVEKKKMRLRVSEMASFFNISDWFYNDVATLSGGQKQLLSLASVMAMQPKVIILDEPTSQLDPIVAADFLNTLKRINEEFGTTIIISEHRLEELMPYATKVVVMKKGKVISSGNVDAVSKYLHDNNESMMSAMPAAVRMYYALDKKLSDKKVPVSIRDGRNYLGAYVEKPGTISNPAISDYDEEAEKKFAVTVKDVHFRYTRDSLDVLKGAALKVPENTIFAILGGNGAGKSTLISAVSGVIKPYSGKIFIGDKNINKIKPAELYKDNLVMLPQNPESIFVKNNVKDELLEMLSGSKLSDSEKDKRVMEVAEKLGIAHLFDKHPYDISGGEKQKVGLGKVLLTNPKILILDEPTKGLDNAFKDYLSKLLYELKDNGMTIILVSHDVEFCAKYADLCALMFKGEIVTVNYAKNFFMDNQFYTTTASRISRDIIKNAVTVEDIAKAVNK